MANRQNTVNGNADANQQGVTDGVVELNEYSDTSGNRPEAQAEQQAYAQQVHAKYQTERNK